MEIYLVCMVTQHQISSLRKPINSYIWFLQRYFVLMKCYTYIWYVDLLRVASTHNSKVCSRRNVFEIITVSTEKYITFNKGVIFESTYTSFCVNHLSFSYSASRMACLKKKKHVLSPLSHLQCFAPTMNTLGTLADRTDAWHRSAATSNESGKVVVFRCVVTFRSVSAFWRGDLDH